MEQFSLEKWLQDKDRKVVTRDGRPVRIVCWDAPTKNPIYGFVEGDDGITSWRKDGRFSNLIDNVDLFFADEEPTIEIPFGAKDSEFIKDEYLIPEGCKARIEGNKVIIEKIQKEEKLTEFEKMLRYVLECYCGYEFASESEIETLKLNAKSLLDLARKELQPEFEAELDKAYKTADNVQYQKGKQDALKDLPKWEHNIMFPKGFSDIAAQGFVDCVYSDGYLRHGKYQIKMSDLEKLAKEE